MIKEFIESLEKFLLVCAVELIEERGVVGFAFLFNKVSASFILAVVSRLVTLLLVTSTK